MKVTSKILAIVPCFNEARSISSVVQALQAHYPSIEILVVDDHSDDRTYEIASSLTTCVRLISNLGIGGAVQTGIKYAAANDFDLAFQVDGDGQHLVEELSKLIEAWQETQADLVIGSRFLHAEKSNFRSSFLRRLGIKLISSLFWLIFRHTITDPTSGYRLLGRRSLVKFAERYPRDFPEPVSLAMALRDGLRVKEIGVKMRPREHGKSSISGIKSVIYMIRVISYILLVRFGGAI